MSLRSFKHLFSMKLIILKIIVQRPSFNLLLDFIILITNKFRFVVSNFKVVLK